MGSMTVARFTWRQVWFKPEMHIDFTDDPEGAALRMRERGVYVVPIPGALRIALCSTPARDVPRLVQALRVASEPGAD